MAHGEALEPTAGAPQRSTGSLKTGTGSLDSATAAAAKNDHPAHVAPARRDLSTRIAETIIFLLAIVGAVAIGLGITEYLGLHPYVYAYLIAYAAFRIADLLVREQSMLGTDPAHFARRVMNELPVLAAFAAAPLERSYYTGDAPNWLAALGILIELIGLWLVLGARVQLGFYSAADTAGHPRPLITSGFYRFIRHPIYLAEFLVMLAWPFEWAAPITMIAVAVIGAWAMNRHIQEDEAEMLAMHGDAYAAYKRKTDAVIPNLW
jgi:protein-S-isoprenylcysteine O-methyltransferase Ste14